MRREAGTFACAEHAIAVAYLMLALSIEPKNPTQMVCEALRERFDATYDRKALSGLSPHEWHAQAVFIVKLMERTLGNGIGFHLLRAQHATGLDGAESARKVSEWLNPVGEGRERLVTDMLVCRMLRGRPRIRDLSDRFDVPKSTLHDVLQAYRCLAGSEREAALASLDHVMRDVALVVTCPS
ncbi:MULTISPECIES: hypothetical protein [Achromobacter]|uniref:HTH iclR-type domain-containing protein n=1 Tax=Achromobacter spanius TaxID=217203 RepID=A0ABY8GV04_9BURK|nr:MULTISPECIES: hypothetical protein [Achromobacter]WAI82297.1 hypothetical protein N8Z00_22610 [Achromobacter spanius]WEX92384.1 hypothetical protein N3Z32_17215 [Achromobacter sp. SS2-2022]WFP08465.1 hypothetical protein P8T11_00915 [Achromobacter spanius]